MMEMPMHFEKGGAEDYILQIPKFTRKNSPESTREFYEFLGCPGEKSRILHVAGTNGKGSVCSYLNAVLTEAGVRTGLFTSPHLVDMKERFRVNGVQMSGEELEEGLSFVLDRCREFQKKTGREEYHPTFFEILLFIGMRWFEQQGAEAIVLETGMGGRLDATNVTEHPAVCVITRIGLDHMEHLGNTKEKIAGEKAGIIKKKVPVVYLDQDSQVSRVIAGKAEKMCAKAIPVSEKDVALLKFKNKTVAFSMASEYYEYIRVCLHTAAFYQWENAALAVRALEVLSDGGSGQKPVRLTRAVIERGLAKARWEGRMEEVLPGVVIDGAHNEDGIAAFLESVRLDGCAGERFLLFSAVSDKRAGAMAEQILDSGLFSGIAVTRLESSRSLTEEQLLSLWKGRAALYANAGEAFRKLVEQKRPEDMVYAAGSLYLVGELKKNLEQL